MYFQTRFVLCFVVHFIRKGGHVVANAAAHWYSDLFTARIWILWYGGEPVARRGTDIQRMGAHAAHANTTAAIRQMLHAVRMTVVCV